MSSSEKANTMNRRTALLAAIGGTTLLAAPGILHAQSAPAYTPDPRKLRISTGSTAGNYHWATVDRAGIVPFIGDAFPGGIVPLPSSGSLENLRRLRDGECDMAWCQEDVLIDFTKTDLGLRRQLPVFRQMYVELLQIVAGANNGWDSLSDMAKAGGELGIGRPGSGLAETWRIISTINKEAEQAYSKIAALPVGADYNRFVEVRDTRGMAQALLEGPGSDNSAVANEVSPVNGKAGLRLLDVSDNRLAGLKRLDGSELYQTIRLKPQAAVAKRGNTPGRAGFYDQLLSSGGVFSSAGVATLGVRCLLLVRAEYRAALPSELSTRLGRAVDAALGGIRKKVNPFEVQA